MGAALSLDRERKNSASWVYVLQKTSHKEILRHVRAVTANYCTSKCAARAKILFFDVFVAVSVPVAFATLYVFTNVNATRVHIAFVIRFCGVQCSARGA